MSKQDDDRKKIAQRLKEMREYLALSQDEVSQLVNIQRPAISLIESGERKVEVSELMRFADAYHCTLDQLTGSIGGNKKATSEAAFLAKAVAKLTETDRKELLRFAEFLSNKNRGKK
jgi:transcriptional regulator with XRE-family HTH domain